MIQHPYFCLFSLSVTCLLTCIRAKNKTKRFSKPPLQIRDCSFCSDEYSKLCCLLLAKSTCTTQGIFPSQCALQHQTSSSQAEEHKTRPTTNVSTLFQVQIIFLEEKRLVCSWTPSQLGHIDSRYT